MNADESTGGFGEQLEQVLSAATEPPPWWMLLVMVGLGVGLTLPGSRFRQANLVALMVHEAGHAAMAVVCGGRVEVIQLYDVESGVTESRREAGLVSALVSWAGYAAPPAAAWGVAALLAGGKAPLVLSLGVMLALLVLLVSRDVVTVALVLAFGGAMALLLWYAPPAAQVWIACGVLGLLLTHSVVAVPQAAAGWLAVEPGERIETSNDAINLYQETGCSPYLWCLSWMAWIGFCWWKCFWLLWPVA